MVGWKCGGRPEARHYARTKRFRQRDAIVPGFERATAASGEQQRSLRGAEQGGSLAQHIRGGIGRRWRLIARDIRDWQWLVEPLLLQRGIEDHISRCARRRLRDHG